MSIHKEMKLNWPCLFGMDVWNKLDDVSVQVEREFRLEVPPRVYNFKDHGCGCVSKGGQSW